MNDNVVQKNLLTPNIGATRFLHGSGLDNASNAIYMQNTWNRNTKIRNDATILILVLIGLRNFHPHTISCYTCTFDILEEYRGTSINLNLISVARLSSYHNVIEAPSNPKVSIAYKAQRMARFTNNCLPVNLPLLSSKCYIFLKSETYLGYLYF